MRNWSCAIHLRVPGRRTFLIPLKDYSCFFTTRNSRAKSTASPKTKIGHPAKYLNLTTAKSYFWPISTALSCGKPPLSGRNRQSVAFETAKYSSSPYNPEKWNSVEEKIMERKRRSSVSYQNAVYALNSLQSNAGVLEKIRRQREVFPEKNVEQTKKCLEVLGIKPSTLDALNIIHVSGTKGKGSTCAFSESIIRHHGMKTGFYSSPHLIHVRERIRINGEPLSEDRFAKYFWDVYSKLEAATDEVDMPAYFKFLTVMAFYVFLQENVDVALMEVGIGGAYDCTNVILNPWLCAITILDYDHMSILGNTLEEIAWNKAGIFKPNSIALTVPQPPGTLSVLCRRAQELHTSLFMVPPISEFSADAPVYSGIPGPQQFHNIASALVIAKLWLDRKSGVTTPVWDDEMRVYDKKTGTTFELPILSGFKIPANFALGVEKCRWPGRSQIVKNGPVTYFLDGAHTPKSLEYCSEWFMRESEVSAEKKSVVRVLIFHCTADRNADTLLPSLIDCDFNVVIFCPPILNVRLDLKSDQTNMMTERSTQMARCLENRESWLRLWSKRDLTSVCAKLRQRSLGAMGILPILNIKSKTTRDTFQSVRSGDTVAMENKLRLYNVGATLAATTRHQVVAEVSDICESHKKVPKSEEDLNLGVGLETAKTVDRQWEYDQSRRSTSLAPEFRNPSVETFVHGCIKDAVNFVENRTEKGVEVQVLVTGSLHLVGGILSALSPDVQ